MSKSIFSNGFIYEGVEDFKPDLEEVYTDASLNAAFVRHLKKFPYFQYLGDNLKEWQTVLEGVDYEKGYQGWNFIEQKWEDVTQEDYEHLLDPARCIIAKPLPVNQSVMGEEVDSEAWKVWEEDQKTNPNPVNPHAFVYGYNIAKKKYNK